MKMCRLDLSKKGNKLQPRLLDELTEYGELLIGALRGAEENRQLLDYVIDGLVRCGLVQKKSDEDDKLSIYGGQRR